ncbi:hypothetical protein [Halomonas saccharevitans]|uniref:Uncharacterized protein n=1 Tax=Halomonas saccharevitans TaxID=416872 RepID=A0A1I7B3S7_9GAMM|nr:hypothetical protein [Halomonas saccharevitans]SFT81853.1 hypothetical protein SAMN04487956_12239 [Halomonas saccharevitans]
MSAKERLKGFLYRSPGFFQRAVVFFVLYLESGLQSIRCLFLRFKGMQELDVLSYKNKDLPRRCHILGSGWSLNYSYSTIDLDNDFVIGFNFSYLKCNHPDLHFVENASGKNEFFAENMVLLYYGLCRHRVFDNSLVVFKNLSEMKNDLRLISGLYSKKAVYVKDKHYRVLSEKCLRYCVDNMTRDNGVLPQAYSSAVGLIFLAFHMGFEEIVIHGLDFGGPHFYGSDLIEAIASFDNQAPPKKDECTEHQQHKTSRSSGGVSMQDMLVLIKEDFENKGVKLYSTSPSPSSSILGYSNEFEFFSH